LTDPEELLQRKLPHDDTGTVQQVLWATPHILSAAVWFKTAFELQYFAHAGVEERPSEFSHNSSILTLLSSQLSHIIGHNSMK